MRSNKLKMSTLKLKTCYKSMVSVSRRFSYRNNLNFTLKSSHTEISNNSNTANWLLMWSTGGLCADVHIN